MTIKGVPRVPSGARSRARLTARFDGPEAIVIAQAPAGYGKTVAMAQWASATDSDGIWLRIREGNAEPAALVQHLATELLIADLLDVHNPLLLAADALAGGADPWLLLRHGLRMLRVAPVLVFDSIDRLSQESVDGLVNLVIDVPSISIRATARQTSAATEPALAFHIDVATIGPAELALTAEEAAEILPVDAGSAAVAQVLDSGGLPLVAQLMAQRIREDGHSDSPAKSSIAEIIDSFIRAEITGKSWHPRFAQFVTVTSVAESIDRRLAAELDAIGRRSATTAVDAGSGEGADAAGETSALLDRAEAEGLGLWGGKSRDSSTFVYTPAIRDAFERRLRADQPHLVRALSLAVAQWELENANPFAALRRSVEFDDWTLAARVVRQFWNELLRNYGPQARRLFAGTPLGILRRQPLISMLLALNYNRTGHHRLRALEFFALAGHASRTQRERSSPADRAVLRSIETAALRVSGKFDAALTAALDGRDILLAMSPDERDNLGLAEPTLHNQIGTTLFYAGRTEAALDSFARSAAVGESKGLKAGLQGMALSAGTLAVAGDLTEARILRADAHRLEWPEGWITGYMGSFYQLAGAFSALESFDVNIAEEHLRLLDPHRETIEHWPLLAHADVLVCLLRNEPERARVQLEREITHQRRRGAASAPTLARLTHTRALVELAAGNPAAAEKILAKAQSSRSRVGLARIALARAQPDDALRHLLREGEPANGDAPSSRSRGEALALRAGALALLGDTQRTEMAIRTALTFLADRGQGLALALVPADALDAVCAAARSAGVDDPTLLLSRARANAIVPSAASAPSLTPREIALALALPHSHSTNALAEALSISPNTVKTQLRGLYRKLGVGSRREAIAALSVVELSAPLAEESNRLRNEPFD